MPPKRRKAAVSKEEQERVAREQADKLHLEELIKREREAEERQERENDRRDHEEEEERKRMKKEEQIRLLAQKDSRIMSLTAELDSQKLLFSAERTELETELERMLQLRESLLDELSLIKSESDETIKALLEERDRIARDNEQMSTTLLETKGAYARFQEEATQDQGALQKRCDVTQDELATVRGDKERGDRDGATKLAGLEREVQKLAGLNSTLQEVIESREADDRKNVTLMQLLNNQLDESKRKSQEVIDEQRTTGSKLKQQVVTLEAKVQQLKDENDLLRREKEQLQRQAESDLHDYEKKIEQLKFDMKYLHSELHSFKNQCQKQQTEVTQVRAAAEADSQTTKLESGTLGKRVEELEAMLRRKDREHFDKATFLNAQIANNRTIISQLQQKLKAERDDRVREVEGATQLLEGKSSEVQQITAESERKKLAASDIEMRLSSDNSILKSTVYQLQGALVEREKEMDTIISSKDDEITRLRRKLDENFIPHRSDIAAAADDGKPTEVLLGERVSKLSRDLDVRSKTAHEVEARLKGQLSNQGHIIDSLQAELTKTQSDADEKQRLFAHENASLKELLDTHCIPYKN